MVSPDWVEVPIGVPRRLELWSLQKFYWAANAIYGMGAIYSVLDEEVENKVPMRYAAEP